MRLRSLDPLIAAPMLAVALSAAPPAASAQGLPGGTDLFGPLMHGALVFHGNYCGPGSRGLHPAPVDALDAACQRHDACTVDFQVPACGCNKRLVADAARIAADPHAPMDEREAANFTAESAQQLPCR